MLLNTLSMSPLIMIFPFRMPTKPLFLILGVILLVLTVLSKTDFVFVSIMFIELFYIKEHKFTSLKKKFPMIRLNLFSGAIIENHRSRREPIYISSSLRLLYNRYIYSLSCPASGANLLVDTYS